MTGTLSAKRENKWREIVRWIRYIVAKINLHFFKNVITLDDERNYLENV